MFKKISFLAAFILCILCLSSCMRKGKTGFENKNYKAAVVVTSGNKDKSEMIFYDNKLKEIFRRNISFVNIASSFDPPVNFNQKIYMIPRGVPFQNEREEVMEYDLKSHDIHTYEIGKPGLSAFDLTSKYIFTTNTLNGISTLSRYDKSSGEIKRCNTKSFSLNFIHCYKEAVFVTANRDTKIGTSTYLLKFNGETLKIEWKKKIPFYGDPCFFYSDNKNLYLSSGGEEKTS